MEARTPALGSALADYCFWLLLAADAVDSLRRARRNAETAFVGAERTVGRSYADRALALRQLAPHIHPSLGDVPERAWETNRHHQPNQNCWRWQFSTPNSAPRRPS